DFRSVAGCRPTRPARGSPGGSGRAESARWQRPVRDQGRGEVAAPAAAPELNYPCKVLVFPRVRDGRQRFAKPSPPVRIRLGPLPLRLAVVRGPPRFPGIPGISSPRSSLVVRAG